MSPVRISDKMPAELLRRRRLDVRLWQTITAMRCLQDKGVTVYQSRDIIGEIDQRMETNEISPMLNTLHNRGLLRCLTPSQSKSRRFTVIDWPALDKFQVMLAEHPEQLKPHISWTGVKRQPVEICKTDERGVIEDTNEEVEELAPSLHLEHLMQQSPPHTNGRKKVGWFKRWFTTAELVEEVRETNRRLEKLLEAWK